MTDQRDNYGDPTTAAFWEAASQRKLVVQHCQACDHYQFYPRPFCLACESNRLVWTSVSGRATVYSLTVVHTQVIPELTPPYCVALVELDEGPRFLTHIEGGEVVIDDRVVLAWRDRHDAPPLPIWIPA